MTQRDRMIEKSHEVGIGTYVAKFVAKEFQKMIRAEAAAKPTGGVPAIIDGRVENRWRYLGDCVCVTCGALKRWNGGGMHTGHFVSSRRFSILFEEDNVAPQCNGCNTYRSGMPTQYRLWMEAVRGQEVIERLEGLKLTTRKFTREELVDMRIAFKLRLKEAEHILAEVK